MLSPKLKARPALENPVLFLKCTKDQGVWFRGEKQACNALTPVIMELGRSRQEDQKVRVILRYLKVGPHPGLHETRLRINKDKIGRTLKRASLFSTDH